MDLQDLHALDTSKWNECWQAEQVLFADSKHFCNISRVDRTCYSLNEKNVLTCFVSIPLILKQNTLK